jgi:hypothetical protein
VEPPDSPARFKHRRLPELGRGRDGLFWWQGTGQDSVKKWRALVPSGRFLEDNQLILEMGAVQGNGRPDVKLMQEINLLLVDDPSPYRRALGERLEQLHQSLSGWVLPRIFVTADGNPPPIMISFRPRSDRLCAALCLGHLLTHRRDSGAAAGPVIGVD